MVRVALAPCSPFSVTPELMRDAAALARRRGVRLHTHLAETLDEEDFCLERFGMRPVEYLDDVGWLGDDVWLAHCVHLDAREVARFGETGTGVAHCPSSNARLGAGIAPVAACSAPARRSASASTAPPRNEAGELAPRSCARRCCSPAWRGGPAALTAREALALATIGGARCLGRADELGSLEAGKLADVALWRVDDLGHAGIADPVAALVLGPPRAAWSCCWWAGAPWSRRASCGRPTRTDAGASRRGDRGSPTRRSDDMTQAHHAPSAAHRRRPTSAPAASASSTARLDGVPKVTGEFEYSSDMWAEGMLWGATLRSPHPRARSGRSTSPRRWPCPACTPCSRTRTCPGARSTAWSIPDQPVLAWDTVRYQGEAVAIVAADHPETRAARRRRASRSTTRSSSRVTDARAGDDRRTRRALHPSGNVLRHSAISHGDPDGRRADVVVSGEYEVGMQDQAFLGPESGLAVPDGEGGVDLYIATQWLHVDRDQLARVPRPAPGAGAPARSPAWAAPSAAARTCPCRSTRACSRCTPAGR